MNQVFKYKLLNIESEWDKDEKSAPVHLKNENFTLSDFPARFPFH